MRFTVLLLFMVAIHLCVAAQASGWAEKIGSSLTSLADGIATDSAGYIYTTGSYAGYVDFDGGPGVNALTSVAGSTDAYIQQLDPNGHLRWALSIGGPGEEAGRGVSIDAMGNILLTGIFTDSVDLDPGTGTAWAYSHGGTDVYIVKLNSAGHYLWSATIGSSGNEDSHAIATDHVGAVYATGDYSDTMDLDPGAGGDITISQGDYDIFLVKLDTGGHYLWGMGAGSEEDNESGMSLAIDAQNHLYMTGYFMETVDFAPGAAVYNMSSHGEEDIFVVAYDSSGHVLWGRDFGGGDLDHGTALALDGQGHVYVTGNYGTGAVFGTDTPVMHGAYDAFLLQLDTTGRLLWAYGIGGTAADVGLAITAGPDGTVYVGGVFGDTVDFDPGTGTHILASTYSAYYNTFIASYTSAGQYLTAGTIPCTTLSAVAGMTLSGGHLCATGRFLGTATFAPDGVPLSLTTDSGFINSFTVRWEQLPTGVCDIQTMLPVTTYPDPVQDEIHISLPASATAICIEISDLDGQVVYKEDMNQKGDLVIRTPLPEGEYFIRGVTDTGASFVARFARE